MIDPEMGVGAYQISGGASGAYLFVQGINSIAILALGSFLFSSTAVAVFIGLATALAITLVIQSARQVGESGLQTSDIEFILEYTQKLAAILSGFALSITGP